VVGVAGIMGGGKSTVARVFEELGALRVDADGIGKSLLQEKEIRNRLVDIFGEGILGPEGRISAVKLGEAAFSDRERAGKLNQVTGEPLVSRIRERIRELVHKAEVIVVDAALLPEWGAHKWLDYLLVVDSDEEACVERIVKNSRFTEAEVRARMACQFPRQEKARYADRIIVNDGSEAELVEKARRAYEEVLRLRKRSDTNG